jgi:hypothetical protein
MLPPLAAKFWDGVRDLALAAAANCRQIYTGNGQTYALYVLLYFLALYGASTGLSGFRIGGLKPRPHRAANRSVSRNCCAAEISSFI